MILCPLCLERNLREIYHIEKIPCLQNRLVNSTFEAKNVTFGELVLVECRNCGFVFNRTFEPEKIKYDANYSNDQTSSLTYIALLKKISKIIESVSEKDNKIIEIGCGNGSLLELLTKDGMACSGFDPAYTGDKNYIVKDYFKAGLLKEKADIIILRHVLEHLKEPSSFLDLINKLNEEKGKFYLEVPALDWIIQKNSFCDIFYEHCNYFTKETLSGLFKKSIHGELYDGQYVYLIACAKDFNIKSESLLEKKIDLTLLKQNILMWKEFVQLNPGFIVWGAGAKGVNFLNLIDPEKKYCMGAIDVNPDKQGKYVPGTGHEVFGPDIIKNSGISGVIVMNPIYKSEIEEKISQLNVKIVSL